jgi:lipopolysaccharide/colanic/teichoic acid biosynthesis glycosyltransferase
MNPLPYTLELEKPETTTRPTKWANSLGKRAMDFSSALALQAIFAVPMLVIGACIAIESRGPVLFNQPRIGKGGRKFIMHKFRTMKHELCDHEGMKHVVKNDERITRVGDFIRKTHLDELPQLWNVMKGDMSMVGPRAHTPKMYQFFHDIPGYMIRTKVKPGITGLPQVGLGKSFTPDDAQNIKTSMWLDNKYVTEASPKRDAEILLATVPKMIGMGRSQSY